MVSRNVRRWFQANRSAANKLSQANVEIVMKVLHSRLKSRTSLALQLQQLGKAAMGLLVGKYMCWLFRRSEFDSDYS